MSSIIPKGQKIYYPVNRLNAEQSHCRTGQKNQHTRGSRQMDIEKHVYLARCFAEINKGKEQEVYHV